MAPLTTNNAIGQIEGGLWYRVLGKVVVGLKFMHVFGRTDNPVGRVVLLKQFALLLQRTGDERLG